MNDFERKPDGGLAGWIETMEAISEGLADDIELLMLLIELRSRRDTSVENEKNVKIQRDRADGLQRWKDFMLLCSNVTAPAQLSKAEHLQNGDFPVDEKFWSAVNDLLYQNNRGDKYNMSLARSEGRALAKYLEEILPLRENDADQKAS